MRDILLLALILALPAFAALGHDIYIAYTNTHLEVSERFYLSDLGWLWITYGPESYNWMIDNTDAAIWNGFIDPLLGKSAFYVGAAPLVTFLAVILFMKMLGVGAFEGQGLFNVSKSGKPKKKKGDFSYQKGGSKRVKYRRK